MVESWAVQSQNGFAKMFQRHVMIFSRGPSILAVAALNDARAMRRTAVDGSARL